MSPGLFNFYAQYIMRNVGWKKHKLESRLLGEISIISRYADDTTLMAGSEELKSLLKNIPQFVESTQSKALE